MYQQILSTLAAFNKQRKHTPTDRFVEYQRIAAEALAALSTFGRSWKKHVHIEREPDRFPAFREARAEEAGWILQNGHIRIVIDNPDYVRKLDRLGVTPV